MTAELRGGPRHDPMIGLSEPGPQQVPPVQYWSDADRDGPDGYGAMVAELRAFLDHIAAARPDAATAAELSGDLRAWRERLAPMAVPEGEQPFGHAYGLLGRGQTMSPALRVDRSDRSTVEGAVVFGRYYLGGNGAAHGGAIPLLFDEIMGRLANCAGRALSRTAFLHTDYRSITPVGVELSVRAWFEAEEGRKRMIRAELRNGDVLCAEAHGLFIALNPGQP